MNITKYYFISFFAMLFGAILTPTVQSSGTLVTGKAHALAVFAGGFVPLVVYYYQLYKIQSRYKISLTDVQIDSIYYLGFLITLTTLVITVGNGLLSVNGIATVTVVTQFCLGLIATGFSLWGRLDLQQRNEKFTDPYTAFEEYKTRMEEVVYGIESTYSALESTFNQASNNFKNSAETLEIFSNTLGKINNEMNEASISLGGGFDAVKGKTEILNSTLTSIIDLSRNLQQLDSQINDLGRSLKEIDTIKVIDLSDNIEKATLKLGRSAQSFEIEVANTARNITEKTSNFSKNFEEAEQQLSSALLELSKAMVAIAKKVTVSLNK